MNNTIMTILTAALFILSLAIELTYNGCMTRQYVTARFMGYAVAMNPYSMEGWDT